MKSFLLTLAILFSLTSCEKENSPSEGYPTIYNLYFELLNVDGSARENGDVEITGNSYLASLTQLVNGQYPWYEMGKIENESTQGNNSILFGMPCSGPNCDSDFTKLGFASGREGVDVNGLVPFEKDKYWLLRYANDDVDTLRVHDIQTIEPDNRIFTFFINEQEVEATEFFNDEFAITIKK